MTRPSFVCPFSLNKLALGSDSRAFVGFTAATGARFQKHDILNLRFSVGTCPYDCNLQGKCVEGECVCESLYVAHIHASYGHKMFDIVIVAHNVA